MENLELRKKDLLEFEIVDLSQVKGGVESSYCGCGVTNGNCNGKDSGCGVYNGNCTNTPD